MYKDGRQDLGPGRSSLNGPPQKSIKYSFYHSKFDNKYSNLVNLDSLNRYKTYPCV